MGRKSRRGTKSQMQVLDSLMVPDPDTPSMQETTHDRDTSGPRNTVDVCEPEVSCLMEPRSSVQQTSSLSPAASGDFSSHNRTDETVECTAPTSAPSEQSNSAPNLPVPDSHSEPIMETHLSTSNQQLSATNSLPVSETNSLHTDVVDPPAERDAVALLQNQLSAMSVRLLTAQDQIDRLLEEKRSWLDQPQSNKQVNLHPPSGELRGRLAQAQALAETYKREKENMVVKYAQSEQKRIELQNQLAALTKPTQQPPKPRGSQITANGVDPNVNSDLSSSESQELQTQLNQTMKFLNAARQEVDALRKGQKNDEARINTLEAKLSQMQETIRTEQRKTATQNETISRLNRSLEAASKQAKEAERLREREAERLCIEVAHKEAQEQVKRLQTECDTLRGHVSEMEPLKVKLSEQEAHLSKLIAENARLSELEAELGAVKQREEQLSEFTRRLTERNANLQAEHLLTISRLEESEQHLEQCKTDAVQSEAVAADRLAGHQLKIEQLQLALTQLGDQLQQSRDRENELRSELTVEREQADLTHKRDLGRIRDLTRQLARVAQNRSMSLTTGLNPNRTEDAVIMDSEVADNESVCKLSLDSPTASSHSVEVGAQSEWPTVNKPVVCLGNTLMVSGEEKPYKEPSEHSESHFDEPDRAAWIAKIDRLQRIQLRLTDKMEFLQEHCFQLTEELNKKSRIIQSFVLAEKHLGSAAPNSVDANRARIAQTGGLMASLYGGKHSKDAHDRETYLEICQKLQAVLEDTLFKNITLKENMATLGSEISSLNNMIKEIRGGVCENCRQVIHNLKPTPPTSPSHSIASIPRPISRFSPEPPTFCGGGVHA
ncbi:hypothetical protein CLF_108655 [Clonorchis sinensis]|uniref:Coiled-coil domain-containing protein n=1 Tax=Clonorchis sinensis TaxID=79923 RepID=H2KSA5_CLOSI|nr:hypothetical protein CLF_108655 [Clonorchis sinensis]